MRLIALGQYSRTVFSSRTAWNLAPNRFSQALERQRASGRQLLDLSASNPTQAGLDYDGQAILSSLCNPAALEYRPEPRGLQVARNAVARYYAEHGVNVDPERVVLTTSTSEAYSFIFRLLANAGDELLVPAPSYPLFQFLADLQDVRLVPYSLFYDHGWHMDVPSVRRALSARTRAVIVVHPNNPTGSFVKPAEAAELSALCASRELALLADEVFLDFAHHETPGLHQSFASHAGCLTFTLSGLSKIAGLPQMKLAWVVSTGPNDLVREATSRLEVIADTYLSMSAPIQLAAPALFSTRHSFQRRLKARIAANLAELDRQLSAQSFCSRLAVEGGWYAVLRVPATGSDEDLAISLLEREGVLVHPGHFYDFRSEGYLVVSLITPEGDFREGISRVLAQIANWVTR